MKSNDPALYESNFERIDKDRYWTHPWLTKALLDTVVTPDCIWEPAAGRGDIVQVLLDHGKDVVASDIDLSEYNTGGLIIESSFFDFWTAPLELGVKGIITNPPYNSPPGIADEFVRHAVLNLMAGTPGLTFVAMLLRSEFCRAKGRRDIFGECPFYKGEVVLTTRPRWDWWFRDEPESSPRHNFSWFVWSIDAVGLEPTQWFHYKDKK